MLRHVLGQFVEADGGAVVALGEHPAALDGAVGNGHQFRLPGAEVGCAQFDHRAGTDEQDVLRRDRFENALGEMDAGGGHRDDVGADRRRAAHFLGHRERALEQLVQLCSERAALLGDAHRFLHLAEDLRLADDHRVEAAGDAEGMANRFRLIVQEEVGRDFAAFDLMVARQPVDDHVGCLGGAVDLGTVAGRQDCCLPDPAAVRQVGQRLM